MKRKFIGMIFVCFVLGLYGCSVENKQTDAVAPLDEGPYAEESSVEQENALYLLSGGTEQGFYHVAEYMGSPRICFVDYESCKDTVLCNKPGCNHDTETCMASPGEGKNIYFVYALRDGTIVYIESNDQVDAGPDQICLADADGSNRRVLAKVQDQQVYADLICADRENLYLLQTKYEGQQSQLFRVSLADGSMEALWEMPNPVPQLIGVDGRNLVWESFTNHQEEIPSLTFTDDMTEEEIRQEEERYQSAMDAMVTDSRAYLLSVDTGEKQELLTWESSHGSMGRSVVCGRSRLYWLDSGLPGDLHWVSQDGSSGECAVNWSEEILSAQSAEGLTIYLERILGKKILLTVYGPWGIDLVKRYALDPESGVLQEVPLRYISNASEKPVRILGKTENTLLVEFEEQAHNTEYIDADGLPAQTLTFTHRTGLIGVEDFLAGIANYQEIQPLES